MPRRRARTVGRKACPSVRPLHRGRVLLASAGSFRLWAQHARLARRGGVPVWHVGVHARVACRGKAFACGPVVYEDMANGLEHWMTAVSVRMPYPYNAYVPNAPVSLPRCTGPCTAARYAHTRHGPRLSAK